MTERHDCYAESAKTPMLPFDPQQVTRLGLRLLPAEFSRLMGTSKQSVSRWIKRGVISLGSDGRLDPREAVRQYMRHADPAKMRSAVMAPMLNEVGALQRSVAELETQLAAERANAEFESEANGELIAQVDALVRHLVDDWAELRALPASAATAAIDQWHADLADGRLDWESTSVLDLAEFPRAESRAEVEEAREGSVDSWLQENRGAGAD
ncbi:MAG: hypothetical protein KKF85_15420 [Gammaproteobacteria bacterium]|nr:hypothetical protein [Rhodocyclaceae bacterium]MBU3907944.1 hypothetical protein [Gammaproteobacteria bacterium]MBU3989786.1 hypothetical protein [Gammaproteobacteria bacterium]MBU4003850.1 hypothetical protein [Gammaproteobacteria bacterium]MBU4021728.1 hypothetical protein [Gammaproteobacteria bacterium]